jgi:hypothetical protein
MEISGGVPGKLPWDAKRETHALEYGQLSVNKKPMNGGQTVKAKLL